MPSPKVKYQITAEDKSRKVVSDVEKRLERAAKVGAAALATSVVAASAALVTLGVRAAKAADEVGKLSTQLGISTQKLSEFDFIAGQTGVKFDAFAISLQRVTRRVSEAAIGTGEAQGALQELGIDAAKLTQLDPGAQFEVLAQQLAKVTSESDQVRLAFKLFDSEGVRLLRTIKETGGNFDELRSRAKQLGAVIDDDLSKKGADVQDAMHEVSAALSGVGNDLLNTFGPAIVETAGDLVEFINSARKTAEAVGLLDARLTDLKLDELNAKWLKNNQEIVKQEQVIKNLHEASRGPARERIAELEAQNQKIKEQIQLLKTPAPDQKKTEQLKAQSVTGDINIGGTDQAARTAEIAAAAEAAKAKAQEDGFQRYLDTLRSEEQALTDSFARRLQIIDQNTTVGSEFNESLKKQEYARLETALLEHQARLGDIEAQGILARRRFEEKNAKARTKQVVSELVNMTAGVAQHSKTLFKINKVAGIANAVINTAQGVTNALAAYPPPISFAMAAAQAAAGFAQINAIKNTSFSGGGTGTTPSGAGGVSTVNSVPTTAPIIDDINQQQSSVINLTFNPGISDTQAVRDFVVEDLSEALRDGAGLDVRVVAQ